MRWVFYGHERYATNPRRSEPCMQAHGHVFRRHSPLCVEPDNPQALPWAVIVCPFRAKRRTRTPKMPLDYGTPITPAKSITAPFRGAGASFVDKRHSANYNTLGGAGEGDRRHGAGAQATGMASLLVRSCGRKVRTGQGAVVGNANPGQPEGKCHRKDTAGKTSKPENVKMSKLRFRRFDFSTF